MPRWLFVMGMPRYYFDTDDGDGFIEDDEGQDLDGIEVARLQAQSGLADMARDVVPGDGTQRVMKVRVRDKTGNTVLCAVLTLQVQMEQSSAARFPS